MPLLLLYKRPNVSGGTCQVINKLLKVVKRHLQRQNVQD